MPTATVETDKPVDLLRTAGTCSIWRSNHIMPWRQFTSSPGNKDDDGSPEPESSRGNWPQMTAKDRPEAFPPPSGSKDGGSWADSVRNHLRLPQNWIIPVAVAALSLGAFRFYQSYLRRIPTIDHIPAGFFRCRSLFGRVTSVGDGDGFHLFHTPGGRLAGWGWLRHVPKNKKQLKGQTVSKKREASIVSPFLPLLSLTMTGGGPAATPRSRFA